MQWCRPTACCHKGLRVRQTEGSPDGIDHKRDGAAGLRHIAEVAQHEYQSKHHCGHACARSLGELQVHMRLAASGKECERAAAGAGRLTKGRLEGGGGLLLPLPLLLCTDAPPLLLLQQQCGQACMPNVTGAQFLQAQAASPHQIAKLTLHSTQVGGGRVFRSGVRVCRAEAPHGSPTTAGEGTVCLPLSFSWSSASPQLIRSTSKAR